MGTINDTVAILTVIDNVGMIIVILICNKGGRDGGGRKIVYS